MTDNPNLTPPEPDQVGKGRSFDYSAEFAATQEQISDDAGNEAIDLLFGNLEWEWAKYNDLARDSPPAFRTEADVDDAALRYLRSKPMGYEATRPEDLDDPEEAARGERIQLAVGAQAVAGVRFYVKGHTADLDYIGVHARLEHHGLGRRLMQSALAYMKDHGITQLTSGNLSRDGLRNRVAVFGPDNLSFYYTDEHREHGAEGPPPANLKEAHAAMDRAYADAEAEKATSEWWRGDAPYTFGVHSELSKVDASGWERPVPAEITGMRVTYN